MTPAGPPLVVLVDLDDTLYPQSNWLEGAWKRVVAASHPMGIDSLRFHESLLRIASQGTDRGRIIDRALSSVGHDDVDVSALVQSFLSHRPETLESFPGAIEALANLTIGHHVVIVTDGVPELQRQKVDALGISSMVDAVVVSDDVSRDMRKPSPEPLLRALHEFGCSPDRAIMIGDRPDKDMLAAERAGIASIRVRTGEYGKTKDRPATWLSVDTFVEAVGAVLGLGRRSGDDLGDRNLENVGSADLAQIRNQYVDL